MESYTDISLHHTLLSKEESDALYNELVKLPFWQKQLLRDDGVTHTIERKMAYIDERASDYHYANLLLKGNTWKDGPVELMTALKKVSEFCGHEFNSVLLNLYENNKDEIRWHSDKEKQLGDEPLIACLNLGATRKFSFRNKETNERFDYPVAAGDLLVMGTRCQKRYLHAILKDNEATGARISLTFRKTWPEDLNEVAYKLYFEQHSGPGGTYLPKYTFEEFLEEAKKDSVFETDWWQLAKEVIDGKATTTN